MSSSEMQVDHVVLLLPFRDIVNPPSWITDNFTVSQGGQHADQKTENKLIFFEDGTYLELIAFIDDDPEKRRGHWWDEPYGIVDYALTTPNPLDHAALNQRLGATGTGITYKAPQKGGRPKADGKVLEWEVTFPQGAQRGAVPFWCHDITPREWRVPVSDNEAAITHPCGAKGIAGIQTEVPQKTVADLSNAVAAIVDSKGEDGTQLFMLSTPRTVQSLRQPYIALRKASETARDRMLLTLVLQKTQSGRPRPADIREEYDGGVVSIRLI